MNQLSWMLYFADVCANVGWLLTGMSVIGLVGGVMWLIAGAVLTEDPATGGNDWRIWRKIGFRVLLPCWLFGVVVGSFVPTKETIYAIAASEMGERVLTTPTAGKAMKALDAWLDHQIAGEASK